MPPNKSASGPPNVLTTFKISCRLKTPAAVRALTPSSAASAMSRRSKTITRRTPPKTTKVIVACKSLMRLTERRSVHQTAFGPETVKPALQLQGALRAKVAFEYFSIVADALDRFRGPVRFDSQGFAIVFARREEISHHRVGFLLSLRLDVIAGNAVLLCRDQRK